MTQAYRCDEVAELKRRRELLALGQQIQCPVVAIHGDYDPPHPAAGGFCTPAAVLDNFRFIRLERCGHLPWSEKEARDTFYEILREELV